MFLRRLSLCGGLLLLSTSAALAAEVGAAAVARAQSAGEAPVVVLLRSPGPQAGAAVSAMQRAHLGDLRRRVLRAVGAEEVRVRHEFQAVAGFVATASPAGLRRLAQHPDVARIDLDAQGSGGLGTSVPQIRADRVHERGLTGDGVVIAILDTGVDGDHPDLADGLIHEECFCAANCCPDGTPRQSGVGSAESRHPHGVHVAGIALSRGALSSPGVAPGADLVAVRVLNDQNRGSLSDWIAGLDWIVANRPDVRVVNMSLVSDALFDAGCDDANALNAMFSELAGMLYERGTLVFAAAGNNGQPDRLTAPACIDRVVAVGAVNGRDEVALFSNGGPGVDLLAPGVGILSDAPGGGITTLSGTSMASPHAAGAAALLFGARPGSRAELIEAALRDTGVLVADSRNGLVVPRVSALAALNAVNEQSDLLTGGGAADADCLMEWNFLPPAIARPDPLPVAVCTDGDPSCDTDRIAGRCTFLLSLCFNVSDPRLPACAVDEPILFSSSRWTPAPACIGDCDHDGVVRIDEIVRAVSIALGTESLAACPAADADDNGFVEINDLVLIVNNGTTGCTTTKDLNGGVITEALPAFPIEGHRICSAFFPFVVPRPATDRDEGVGAIHVAVETDTRRDYDHALLVCGP